jgi:hypothetical protein
MWLEKASQQIVPLSFGIFSGSTAGAGYWVRLGGDSGVPLRLQEELLLPRDEHQAPGYLCPIFGPLDFRHLCCLSACRNSG